MTVQEIMDYLCRVTKKADGQSKKALNVGDYWIAYALSKRVIQSGIALKHHDYSTALAIASLIDYQNNHLYEFYAQGGDNND